MLLKFYYRSADAGFLHWHMGGPLKYNRIAVTLNSPSNGKWGWSNGTPQITAYPPE